MPLLRRWRFWINVAWRNPVWYSRISFWMLKASAESINIATVYHCRKWMIRSCWINLANCRTSLTDIRAIDSSLSLLSDYAWIASFDRTSEKLRGQIPRFLKPLWILLTETDRSQADQKICQNTRFITTSKLIDYQIKRSRLSE